MKNLITDINGILVGNAADERLKSGTTAVLFEWPMVASYAVLGGAPGTRDTDLLEPHQTVGAIDALVLSGGSAFGLDAAGGVQGWLRGKERGFQIGPVRVPLVPAAILFDLINGGNKDWGKQSPYWEFGWQAAENASRDFEIGSFGAGTGALVSGLKGGLGSASIQLENGVIVAALVAVNALGQTTMGNSKHFWAAPFEENAEFGGLGLPSERPDGVNIPRTKTEAMQSAQISGSADKTTALGNTTIGVVATNAKLTKAEAKRLAIMAHDGFTRALWPSHTPMDGDLIFAVSNGEIALDDTEGELLTIGSYAASTMARAIARAVYEAEAKPDDLFPTWQDKFGQPRS
nr:P1 family peptidase [uncultured Cohaesibacter sp.]